MEKLVKRPQSKASKVRALQAKTQQPVYWKQVIVTTFTVYPLILASDWFLKSLFPMKIFEPEVAILFTVALVASLMVFPVMPFITKLLGSWLHKK